jgi:hypothetical protein
MFNSTFNYVTEGAKLYKLAGLSGRKLKVKSKKLKRSS